MLPSAGDVRSGYRPLREALVDAGFRVVTADLPGHGESPPAPAYGVGETADALIELIRSLAAGPAVVVAASFAPAATVVAAAREPGLFRGLVAISPHLEADSSWAGRLQRLSILSLLRGPWAGALWGRLYRGWFKSRPPADLDSHLQHLRHMLTEPARRRAVRQTLVASRVGVDEAMDAVGIPSLFVFGSEDDHFADPAEEAATLARRMGGDVLVVPGAGHYPHMEDPTTVAQAIERFLAGLG